MERAPIRRGAAIGAAVFAGLFGLGLLGGAPTSYFGQSDQAWTDLVFGTYGLQILGFQGWLLLLHLLLGAALGVAAAGVRGFLFPERGLGADLGCVVALHGLFLAWGVGRRPAAYAEWLWEAGGLGAPLQRLVSDVLPGAVMVGALVVAALLAGIGLRRRPAIAGLLALAVGGVIAYDAGGVWSSSAASTAKPHVIVIGVDSLRADRLGLDGPAPRITAQAAQGESWQRAIVPLARTFPSWVSLLTGKLPPEHGVRHMFPSPQTVAAIPEALPELLGRQGWRTGVVADYAGDIFSRWAAGFEVRDVPGFDLQTIVRMRSLGIHHHLLPYLDNRLGRSLFGPLRALADFTDPDDTVDRALSTFDELADDGEPVMLTVFLSGAHFPYAAGRPQRGSRTDPAYAGPYRYRYSPTLVDDAPLSDADVRQVRGLYDEAVAAADAAVGRLLDGLTARQALENAYVVVLSDHGEELHEDSRGFEHGAHLRGDSFLRIPLSIAGPGIEPGSVVEAVQSSAALAPRLAELAGLPEWAGADAGPTEGVAYSETGVWMREEGQRFYQQDRMPYPGIARLVVPLPDGGFMLRPDLEAQVVAAKHRMIEDSHGRLIVRPTPDGLVEEWHPAPGGPEVAPPELRVLLYAQANELRTAPARLPRAPRPDVARAKQRLMDVQPSRLWAPDLDAGLAALRGYRRWIRDPWSDLEGPARRTSVLFGHKADVDKEFHANRRALFLPTPAEVEWDVESGGPLRFSALAPTGLLGGPPVRLRVESGDTVLFDRELGGGRGPGTTDWLDAGVPHVSGQVVIKATVPGAPARTGGRLLLGSPLVLERPDEDVGGWNLLLVQVDALRASDLGVGLTPVMDELAASGTSFSNMIVNHTWTRPSTLALMTGMTSDDLGLNRHTIRLPVEQLAGFYRAKPPLLPLSFRRAGLAVDASVNNLFMLSSHGLGVDFGFQRMGDYRHLVRDTPEVTASAIRFIQANKARRWFQFVNLNAPHMPYTSPKRYVRRARQVVGDSAADAMAPQRLRYLGELVYTDEALGRILGALDATGQRGRTVVMVTADHGEIMDPAHDRLSAIRDKRSLYHHGITPFDEEVRVPLLVAAPGAVPGGRVIDEQVQTLDLARTIAELFGLPDDPRRRGRSLAGLLLRGDPHDDRPVRIVGRYYRAVRTQGMKYVRHETRGAQGWQPDGAEELYDLTADPAEHVDLAAAPSSAPVLLEEGRRLFLALEAAYARPPTDDEAPRANGGAAADADADADADDLHLDRGLDPEVEKLLREWGYL